MDSHAAHLPRMKPGVLLAAFGSGVPAAQRSLVQFEAAVRALFPGVPVRWAFTSTRVRTRLAGEGVKTDSVHKALEKMHFERFTHVALQSLHVTPGAEFEALGQAVEAVCRSHGGQCPAVALGLPLLARDEDIPVVAAAILQTLPPERAAGDIVVLMGHGTSHEADARYDRLAAALGRVDPLVVVGTMDGTRSLETVLAELEHLPPGPVWLTPLLAVAGAHVLKDMAGPGPDSWKSRLQAAGRTVHVVHAGAAERPALAAIWIEHLRQAMTALQVSGG
ncbi:sirohydrochlorin cobaltochelatase [Megalodesulfovibrio gigas]|nr:sirohydrochlorin cobaltochelatase [Megalodesulfovibrio gigas]